MIGIAIASFPFTRTEGRYAEIFLISLIPGGIGFGLLFLVREKQAVVKRAKPHPLKEWKTLDSKVKAFFLLVLLFTLGNSSNQFLLLRAKHLGFDAAEVILAYLVFNLVYAASAYPAGRLSDAIGRRSLLVCGYLFYGVVYLGFSLAADAFHVWTLFAFYGLYSGLTEGVEKALVSELCPGESRATMLGIHASLVGIGLLPASIIGGLLWDFLGATAPFYFGGGVGVAAAIGMYFIVPKQAPALCRSSAPE